MTAHIHYSSIAACKADLTQPWKISSNKERAENYITKNHGDFGWYGVPSLDDFHNALANGHAEGLKAIENMLEQVNAKLPRAVGIGRKIVRGDQGDELDIDAVNRGDVSRAWTSRRRLIKRGRSAVRIVCDIAGNSTVSAESLRWRGVAAMTLAEIMTKAGYKTEIVAGFFVMKCAKNVHEVITTITVKAIGTHPDKGLLSTALCLSGFFRTWGFVSIIRHADNAGKQISDGLGRSGKLANVLPPDERFSQIVVDHDVKDMQSCIEWIVSAVTMLQSVKGTK
jgi:hypothetical protein